MTLVFFYTSRHTDTEFVVGIIVQFLLCVRNSTCGVIEPSNHVNFYSVQVLENSKFKTITQIEH